MNANPAGITACIAMRGTPKASDFDDSTSCETNCQAASVRIAQTVVATSPVNAWTVDCQRAGTACRKVPIDSSRPSRAAAMPPSIPTRSVR